MLANPAEHKSRTRRIHGLAGGLCFALLIGASDIHSSGPAVSQLTIDRPEKHWVDNFIPLVPSIHPPTTHDRGDLIQVWLKLPAGGEIDVKWLPDQERYTLVYPDNTIADRVEYFHVGDSSPGLADYAPFEPGEGAAGSLEWTVADVRGTLLGEDRQWFHVYRPVDGHPQAALVGWRWPRGDAEARRRATELMVNHVAGHDGALSDDPPDQSAINALRRLNDCSGCHVPNRPRIGLADEDRAVERATDAAGFIVPNAVLQDDCVIADHRPEDINVGDDFVTVHCANGQTADLRRDADGYEWFFCEDGSPPRGRRDIEAGLAAAHAYTQAVCASREALFRRMTPSARSAFSESFSVCGID